jgi:hypothetical protein
MLFASVTINNSNTAAGGAPGLFSAVKAFVVDHPYITYALLGIAIGAVAYLPGRPLLGRTINQSLSDPSSTARVIQSNANLRNEMERTRSALSEVRDSLADVKLELARVQG